MYFENNFNSFNIPNIFHITEFCSLKHFMIKVYWAYLFFFHLFGVWWLWEWWRYSFIWWSCSCQYSRGGGKWICWRDTWTFKPINTWWISMTLLRYRWQWTCLKKNKLNHLNAIYTLVQIVLFVIQHKREWNIYCPFRVVHRFLNYMDWCD